MTYCCRDKDQTPGRIPARDRYLSPRIRIAELAAGRLDWDFAILSGLHGLLAPDEPLATYDHLLVANEVLAHTDVCAGHLERLSPESVVLLSRASTVDPGVGPYRDCLERACAVVGVPFRLVEIGAVTPSAEELARLLGDAKG